MDPRINSWNHTFHTISLEGHWINRPNGFILYLVWHNRDCIKCKNLYQYKNHPNPTGNKYLWTVKFLSSCYSIVDISQTVHYMQSFLNVNSYYSFIIFAVNLIVGISQNSYNAPCMLFVKNVEKISLYK